MPGASIDLVTAAGAKTLVQDLGYSERKAGEILDISHESVGRICAGEGNWSSLTEKDPLFAKIRQEQKVRWWKSIWSLQPKLLKNIEDKLKESSAASSTWMFGVLFDKERLLAGESTSNVAVAHHLDVQDMTAAAEAIAHSLLRFSQVQTTVLEAENREIDVSPQPNLIRSEEESK